MLLETSWDTVTVTGSVTSTFSSDEIIYALVTTEARHLKLYNCRNVTSDIVIALLKLQARVTTDNEALHRLLQSLDVKSYYSTSSYKS